MRGRPIGYVTPETRRILDAIQGFIDVDNPTTQRFVLYKLVTDQELSSTKDERKLMNILRGARIRGEVPDEAFVDHKRRLIVPSVWSDVDDFKQDVKESYNRDYWADQPTRVLMLVEKGTVGDVVQHVTYEDQVPLFVSAGNFSRPFLVKIADQVQTALDADQKVAIGYVGDFDPSGLDIERAAQRGTGKGEGSKERQGLLDILDDRGVDYEDRLEWRRLAVTHEQFERLPESVRIPIKDLRSALAEGLTRGDSRAPEYAAKYGNLAAEVEAVGQDVLQGIVQDFIDEHTDMRRWTHSLAIEKKEIKLFNDSL